MGVCEPAVKSLAKVEGRVGVEDVDIYKFLTAVFGRSTRMMISVN